MAEKFEIPKRFTKKWWSYFWEYYKWYVIVIALAVLAVVGTVIQVKNQPKWLFSITYAGSDYIVEEQENALNEILASGLGEEEHDGINFVQLNFDDSQNADIQFQSALYQKLEMEFITDETMLFIFDKSKLEMNTGEDSYEGIWTEISDWAEVMPSEELITNQYGVCLKNSKILRELGINGENMYVAVRNNYNPEDEEAALRHKYSVEAANRLIAE